MTATPASECAPPIRRPLLLLLGVLLLLQVRTDRVEEGDAWSGPRGWRNLARVAANLRAFAFDPPTERLLLLGAAQGMAAGAGDPYTELLLPAEARPMDALLGTSPAGGIAILAGPSEAGILILAVLPDGPARKAGLREGETIVAVDGRPLRDVAFPLALERLRGPAGSPVLLRIAAIDGETRESALVRAPLQPGMPFPGRMLPGRTCGYLRADLFSPGLAAWMEREIRRLQAEGMTALVIDLRWNSGGLFDEAVAAASLFLSGKTVTIVERRSGRTAMERTVHAAPTAEAFLFPVAILVGPVTASAAELFSAALAENGRALLAGGRTFGKARIQEMLPLEGTSGLLRLTIARYLTPLGRDLERTGLEPGLSVPLEGEAFVRLSRDWFSFWNADGPTDPLAFDAPLQRAVQSLEEKTP